MTSLAERDPIMALVSEAIVAGARQDRACAAICLDAHTLQRWQRDPDVQRTVQLGHHVSADAGAWDVFLPVFIHGYF